MATAKKLLSTAEGLSLVQKLMDAAFNRPRDLRSDAYKLGVREILKCKAMGVKFYCPHKMGTAEADAFYSGSDEGNRIWREHVESEAGHGNG